MFVQTEPKPDRELEERLQFETFLADLSSRFVSVPPDQVDREIIDAQGRVCESLAIDHSSLWQLAATNSFELTITHLHRSLDLAPPTGRWPPRCFLELWAESQTSRLSVCRQWSTFLQKQHKTRRPGCITASNPPWYFRCQRAVGKSSAR